MALKPFLSGALLVSSLALLSGCDWFKQTECPSCVPSGTTGAPAKEDVLLSIDGKPVITKENFDDFYQVAVGSDPQAALTPGLAQKAFAYLEQAALMDASVKKNKKDQDSDYKKKLELAYEMARVPVNAEVFQKEILDSIDVSPQALEKFYKEQAGVNQVFERPPFMTKPAGVKIQAVQFNDDKSAKEFLSKVQKQGADFVAVAKADKKDVQNLGVVSAQSKADRAVIARAKDLQPNAIEKVNLSNGKFMVIKGIGPRQPAEYMNFTDIAGDAQLNEYLKQIKQSTDLQSLMTKRFEDLKKELNVEVNPKYAEEKDAKASAEIEAILSSMRGLQEEGGTKKAQEAAAKPAEAAQPETPKSM